MRRRPEAAARRSARAIAAEAAPAVDRSSGLPSLVGPADYSTLVRTRLADQEQLGFRPRGDLPPWPIPEPMRWDVDPFDDPNWCNQLQGWRIMDCYLREYARTGDPAILRRPLHMALTWAAWRPTHVETGRRYIDTVAGPRAQRLALLWAAHRTGALPLTDAEQDVFRDLADRHAAVLLQPGGLQAMNHGFFQAFGLEILCRVFPERPWSATGRRHAVDHVKALVRLQFTDEGVHTENSPSYHYYAIGMIEACTRIPAFADPDLLALLERARWVQPWLCFPDGDFVEVGDSDGRGEPLADDGGHRLALGHESYAVFPFWRSGYAIVRSTPEVPPDAASMLFLTGMCHNVVHKHADLLTFELFEFGRRVVIDSGKFGYKAGPLHAFVPTAAAHNIVDLADRPLLRENIELGGTSLREPRVEDGCFVLSGLAHWREGPREAGRRLPARLGFGRRRRILAVTRELRYRPRHFLIVRDALTAKRQESFFTRLHFDRGLAFERDGASFVAHRDGHEVRVELLDPAPITLYRGSHEPVMGWQTLDYLVAEPATTLEASFAGRECSVTWVISFDGHHDEALAAARRAEPLACPPLRQRAKRA